jgi:hypothetical protein
LELLGGQPEVNALMHQVFVLQVMTREYLAFLLEEETKTGRCETPGLVSGKIK